jgi:hypothetical protein
MRDRYNFPTNEALIAVAVKLEWIPLAIDTTDDPKRRRDQAGGFSVQWPVYITGDQAQRFQWNQRALSQVLRALLDCLDN